MEIDMLPLEVETAANPEYAVIWLHGLGADWTTCAEQVPSVPWPRRAMRPSAGASTRRGSLPHAKPCGT